MSSNKAVQMSPMQLHCVNKRLTLPMASSGELLDFSAYTGCTLQSIVLTSLLSLNRGLLKSGWIIHVTSRNPHELVHVQFPPPLFLTPIC